MHVWHPQRPEEGTGSPSEMALRYHVDAQKAVVLLASTHGTYLHTSTQESGARI